MTRLLSAAAAVALLAAGGASALAQEVTIRYAITDAEGPLPAAQALKTFTEYVEARSDGEIDVVPLYGTGGGQRSLVEQTQLGVIQMSNAADGAIGGFYPGVQIFNIPYLFKSGPVAWQFFQSDFAKEIAEEMREATGIRVLAWGENGFRNLTNNVRTIRTPDDMAGLRFRVMESPVFVRFMEAAGASATPISITEVILALQQGVVDGQENSAKFLYDWGIAEVQDYMSVNEHVYSVQALMINDEFWDTLSEEHQNILQEGAALSAKVDIALRSGQAISVLEDIKAAGTEVYINTPEEREAFREVTQEPVVEFLRTELGDEMVDRMFEAVAEVEEEVYWNTTE
jgi:C4-dicarboxylate-binding protein DctP